MSSISEVWHKHPYIILIGGGAVALYILWPRGSSAAASSGPSDYQAQLAAQEALSATQLQTQAQTAQAKMGLNAAAYAAYAQSLGASNAGIAQSNAQAILGSYQLAASQSNAIASVLNTQAASNAASLTSLAAVLKSWGDNQQAIAGYQAQEVNSLFSNLGPQGIAAVQNNLPIWLDMLQGGGTISGIHTTSSTGVVDTTLHATSTGNTTQPYNLGTTTTTSSPFGTSSSSPYYTGPVGAWAKQDAWSRTIVNSASGSTSGYQFDYTPSTNIFSRDLLTSLFGSLVDAFKGTSLNVNAINVTPVQPTLAGQLTQIQPFQGV